jgi:hypothetical protein
MAFRARIQAHSFVSLKTSGRWQNYYISLIVIVSDRTADVVDVVYVNIVT